MVCLTFSEWLIHAIDWFIYWFIYFLSYKRSSWKRFFSVFPLHACRLRLSLLEKYTSDENETDAMYYETSHRNYRFMTFSGDYQLGGRYAGYLWNKLLRIKVKWKPDLTPFNILLLFKSCVSAMTRKPIYLVNCFKRGNFLIIITEFLSCTQIESGTSGVFKE